MSTPEPIRFALGDKARDKVTGFTGIVIARTEWLHGCARITIQPQKLDPVKGTPVEAHAFDELQCERVAEAVVAPATTEERKKGGPRPDVSRGR